MEPTKEKYEQEYEQEYEQNFVEEKDMNSTNFDASFEIKFEASTNTGLFYASDTSLSSNLTFAENGQTVFTINFKEGTITLEEGFTPDNAAMAFWDTVLMMAPSAIGKEVTIIDKNKENNFKDYDHAMKSL